MRPIAKLLLHSATIMCTESDMLPTCCLRLVLDKSLKNLDKAWSALYNANRAESCAADCFHSLRGVLHAFSYSQCSSVFISVGFVDILFGFVWWINLAAAVFSLRSVMYSVYRTCCSLWFMYGRSESAVGRRSSAKTRLIRHWVSVICLRLQLSATK